jgi:hypothetical protein
MRLHYIRNAPENKERNAVFTLFLIGFPAYLPLKIDSYGGQTANKRPENPD